MPVVSVRLTEDALEAIDARARAQCRSRAAQIAFELSGALSDHQLPVPVSELRQLIGRPGQPPSPEPPLSIQRGISSKPAPRCPRGHGSLYKPEGSDLWTCHNPKCHFTTTDEQVELQRETADYNY